MTMMSNGLMGSKDNDPLHDTFPRANGIAWRDHERASVRAKVMELAEVLCRSAWPPALLPTDACEAQDRDGPLVPLPERRPPERIVPAFPLTAYLTMTRVSCDDDLTRHYLP
jgi:hypothetical protein